MSSAPSSPTISLSSLDTTPPRTPPNLHQNTVDPSARWLVQKFGGTSIGKFAVQIAKNIVAEYIDQHQVAVVCSARSGSTKALGTTSLLLQAASEALSRHKTSLAGDAVLPMSNGVSNAKAGSPSGSPASRGSPTRGSSAPTRNNSLTAMYDRDPSFNHTVDLLRAEHLTAARDAIRDPRILRDLEADIQADCDWLRSFLSAAQVINEISPRSRDNIVGLGEKLACKLMAAVLRDQGVDSEYVSLEDIVTEVMVDDAPWFASEDVGTLDQDFYDRVASAVGERVQQCAPRVPVVTGFFGPVPGSLLASVGRGYTDLLAALLAVGVDAQELQIWKEVDGIFTADPRKVPTARLIPMISPDEAAELTYYGSEVVHPFTMDQVIRRKIPIRIKNVSNPRGGGTVIHPNPDVDGSTAPSESDGDVLANIAALQALSSAHLSDPSLHHPKQLKCPTAVTIKEHIVVVNINSNRKRVSHGFLAGIFETLDRYGVVVDLISTSEVHVSMAIGDGMPLKVLDKLVAELEKSGTVTVYRDMAILSLVGKQMRNMVGIAGRMFTTLAQGNVNIEMISQGASEINISCVIDSRNAVKALNLIHQSCLQVRPEGARGTVGPWLF